jgi:hypothetical protein
LTQQAESVPEKVQQTKSVKQPESTEPTMKQIAEREYRKSAREKMLRNIEQSRQQQGRSRGISH